MIKPILKLQAITSTIFIVASVLILGIEVIISAILGCLCCIVPCIYFFWQASKAKKYNEPRKFIVTFYYAGASKFILTMCCFIIVFTSKILTNPVIFFIGFIQAQCAIWLFLIIENKHINKYTPRSWKRLISGLDKKG